MFLDENRYERKSTWGPDGKWVVKGGLPSVFEAGDNFFEKNMVNFFFNF